MMKCTSCDVPLCRIERDGVPVDVCPECHGTMADAMRFKGIEKRQRTVWTGEQEREVEERAARSSGVRPVRCPKCLEKMAEVPVRVGGGGEVVLDFCRDCDVIWFADGKLELTLILVSRDRELRAAKYEEPAFPSILLQLTRRAEPPVNMDLLLQHGDETVH